MNDGVVMKNQEQIKVNHKAYLFQGFFESYHVES